MEVPVGADAVGAAVGAAVGVVVVDAADADAAAVMDGPDACRASHHLGSTEAHDLWGRDGLRTEVEEMLHWAAEFERRKHRMVEADTASATADLEVGSDEHFEVSLPLAVDVPRGKSAAVHHNTLARQQSLKACDEGHLEVVFAATQ